MFINVVHCEVEASLSRLTIFNCRISSGQVGLNLALGMLTIYILAIGGGILIFACIKGHNNLATPEGMV